VIGVPDAVPSPDYFYSTIVRSNNDGKVRHRDYRDAMGLTKKKTTAKKKKLAAYWTATSPRCPSPTWPTAIAPSPRTPSQSGSGILGTRSRPRSTRVPCVGCRFGSRQGTKCCTSAETATSFCRSLVTRTTGCHSVRIESCRFIWRRLRSGKRARRSASELRLKCWRLSACTKAARNTADW
jgi:hypothetical protein